MSHTSNGSRGTTGHDVYIASHGNDHHFYGYGEGHDILVGGNGNDVFELEDDLLLDLLAGGGGEDTLDYSGADMGLSVDLSAGTTTTLLGATAREYPAYSYQGPLVTVFSGMENVTGTRYDDVFAGNWADNEFDGGAGIDRVTYENATQGVTVDFRNDTVTGHSVGTDTLRNIEQVEGSRFDDTFYGSNQADVFVFGPHIGHDTINGFEGRDNRNNHDMINFEGVFEDWDDLEDHISHRGNTWTIEIDDHNSITITNVQGSLGENDFYFG